ncbi:carbamoyltransferase C-terminal domain-containing protein [Microbacterium lacticum]
MSTIRGQGPALGNRSFLAIPSEENRTLVSEKMKRREWFRPVAPAFRAADASMWLKDPITSPYMSFAGVATASFTDTCPGVVHADGTARHQTVDHDTHPGIATLLDCLADLGVPPVVINTSLNTGGRPIALDSSDAFATALDAGAHSVLTSAGLTRLA